MNNESYQQLLSRKKQRVSDAGFDVLDSDLNPNLFPFQRHIVRIALKKGRFALFEDCGMGKTLQQLAWADAVVKHSGRPVIVLCPLAVSGQTIQEGEKFGIGVTRYDRAMFYESALPAGIYITNYEQSEWINPAHFAGVVLDESSILKNFEGKTRKAINEAFADTPYKLPCTATPSPNDPMELGTHAEFLGVMTREQMLAMFFVHDGGDTSKWRIKGHAEGHFWEWVAQWAVVISKPSDIGFSDEGYILPALNIHEQQIETEKRENGKLFNDVQVSATDFNKELRLTLIPRMEWAAELVNASPENFIVWVKQDEEADKLRELAPDAVEVRGSQPADLKEERLLGFANNQFRVLLTKPKIAQFGMNYQNCANQIHVSLDFSFEALYQTIRRSWRFGQDKPVNIYLVTTDTMQNVIKSIREKQKMFDDMQAKMKIAMQKNSQIEIGRQARQHETADGENFKMILGDCVQAIQNLPDESVDFSIFSPPFASLYTYSDQVEDMGNVASYEDFCIGFDLMVKHLYRILQSGRNVAVHCMDLPIQKGKEGVIGLRDFSGLILRSFENAGFVYHSRVTIWKDPVTEMQRTKALGLLHKQVKKDAAMSRVGIPDYLLIFRKDGEATNPVVHQDSDPAKPNYLPVGLWQKYASPVWMDIDYGDTLNVREAREENDERHICPLQLPTIKRALHLWTNEGDTVFTPFAGIGSEVFQALKMGRKGIGIELKKAYFDTAVKNCRKAEGVKAQAEMILV